MTVIGERINPTGKKRLKQALIEEDYDYLLSQAVQQADAGAQVLDVNVGIPDIEEARVLPAVVKKIQAVTDLPLQIDSSDPAAIEAALRVYNGKAIVNSVNGEEKSLSSILPVVKKYGAAARFCPRLFRGFGLPISRICIIPSSERKTGDCWNCLRR